MRIFPRFVFPAAALALVAVLACSNQGEGERCDHNASNSGNDDCQDGLVCTMADSLANGMGYDACCPLDRTQATTAVCSLNKTTGIDASVTTPDASPDTFVAPPPDAAPPVDAGQDAPPPGVDAPVDSPVDAPSPG